MHPRYVKAADENDNDLATPASDGRTADHRAALGSFVRLPRGQSRPTKRAKRAESLVSTPLETQLCFEACLPVTADRFHVLLNPLFRVLCNFPSRYLFAIGLVESYLALDGVYH